MESFFHGRVTNSVKKPIRRVKAFKKLSMKEAYIALPFYRQTEIVMTFGMQIVMRSVKQKFRVKQG